MSLATEEYGAAFFANGANPGGVLEHPGVIKDIQRVKDSWSVAPTKAQATLIKSLCWKKA